MAWKTALLVVAAFGLAACATPTLKAGNEVGGIVAHTNGTNAAEGLAVADAHCHAVGKIARVSTQDAIYNTMTFDCVRP